jgi:secretory phospholipase A2
MILFTQRLAIALGLGIFLFAKVSADDNNDPPPIFNVEDMMGGNKACPPFRCSGGYTPTPKSRLKFESTGCSSMGAGIVMSTGQEEEKAFAPCCDQWHACYQICGMAKKTCDDEFKTCSDELCGDDEDCTKSAGISAMMTRMQGCQKYDQAQYQACECVLKDKAAEKREAAIRYFYKKHAPESVGKAGELAKKASTSSKMAGLLRKLLKKYPKSIQKIEDPQQERMRKIMEEKPEKHAEKDETEESEEYVEL